MVSESNDGQETQELSRPNGVRKEQALDGDDKTKTRHPRWTRQETFVLIESKKVVENQFQWSRRSTSALRSDQIESKWDSVSSYCRQHGVNRGPVQCRKRWGNMLCDFKKIKTWESQQMNEAESFWMMRNELRRERKLPSFFDKEVYYLLDGRVITTDAIPLSQITFKKQMDCIDRDEAATAEEEEEEHEYTEANLDSSQCARAEDGLFLEWEQPGQDKTYWSSKKETTATGNLRKTRANPLPISSVRAGTTKKQNLGTKTRKGSMSREGKKRRLSSDESEDPDLEDRLIKVLGRNMSMLNSQLKAQNINCQLDREQRKDHNDSLVSALNKLTDAIVKIADKL
ncbi:trihelix transcription factor ASR3-like [Populus nigra]|uniref:trihelix transcription factor ASR3-like n=1 Tax=Populus nigra TaxID=3691 RepID=UPI002B267D23|nr:trihelix transcription factor ASR3-like [Populus nigra]